MELISEADRRYSGESWEFESKETAVHIGSSMLKYDKAQDSYIYPGGRKMLYRPVEVNNGAVEKPCIEIYSPDIRFDAYKDGWNEQLRRIEFACNLAYGTISDPNNIDRTATEIESSKQRSYSFICDCQKSLENALNGWADGTAFWLALNGQSVAHELKLEWGDGIISNPDAEREEDRKDLANGTLRPEEYRAKYRNETLDEAAKNLPQTAAVLGDDINVAVPAEVQGKSLNGAQTQSLIAIMAQYSAGDLTEGQAINLISTAIGISKEEARKLLNGEVTD